MLRYINEIPPKCMTVCHFQSLDCEIVATQNNLWLQ